MQHSLIYQHALLPFPMFAKFDIPEKYGLARMSSAFSLKNILKYLEYYFSGKDGEPLHANA
jgi:hypothetical protein